jgi:hypothetical protein
MNSNRMNMLEKRGTPINIRTGNAVRIRRTWRAPQAGCLGVVSAIEPNDAYGAYVIEFEDGLHFRYHCQEFEPVLARSAYFYQRALGKLCGLIRMFVSRWAETVSKFLEQQGRSVL